MHNRKIILFIKLKVGVTFEHLLQKNRYLIAIFHYALEKSSTLVKTELCFPITYPIKT